MKDKHDYKAASLLINIDAKETTFLSSPCLCVYMTQEQLDAVQSALRIADEAAEKEKITIDSETIDGVKTGLIYPFEMLKNIDRENDLEKDRVMKVMAEALEYLRDENIFKATADAHINQALADFAKIEGSS